MSGRLCAKVKCCSNSVNQNEHISVPKDGWSTLNLMLSDKVDKSQKHYV